MANLSPDTQSKINALRDNYTNIGVIMGKIRTSEQIKAAFINSLRDIMLKYRPICDLARFKCLDDKEAECLAWYVAADILVKELEK